MWRPRIAAAATTKASRLFVVPMLSCALIVFAEMAVRGLFDTFAPPANYGPRSAVTTFVAIGTYVAIGGYAAFILARVGSAVLLTLLSHLTGHLLNIVFTLALYYSVIERNVRKLAEFDVTGGFDETIFLPLLMAPVVILLGVIGTGFGMLARRVLGASS